MKQFDFTRFDTLVAEGRIIRGDWQRKDEQGRETACLLGALAPDIQSSSDCPAGLMPDWLAELTTSFEDKTSASMWPTVISKYANLIHRWHILTPEDWDCCLAKTLRTSLEIALPHDTKGVVQPVIDLIDRWLSGDKPSNAEFEAAEEAAAKWSTEAAAKAAAKAAEAAKLVTWAAAAVWAAEAAAAANLVAWSPWAAKAATWTAAWDKITFACLDAIEAKITEREAQ